MKKEEKVGQFRQGDVLIERLDTPVDPKKEGLKEIAPENGRLILAHGEVTGHAHAISARNAMLFQQTIGMLLILKKASEVLHEEHPPVYLPMGEYKITRQREYTPEKWVDVRD